MAYDAMEDLSYFGTMMVHLGQADGMVSGAVHTTQHTIRPSFEIVKTRPGVRLVSSVFFMCLADQVLVYGDCAVNPNPNAEDLADIAITSAATAAAFGIEPRVAMLSYSTGASGKGEDVERVRAAVAIAHRAAPGPQARRPHPVRRRHRRHRGALQDARQRGGGARHRLHLPGPQHRQQHLQGGAAQCRGRGHRPGPAGPEQAGQ